MMPPSTRSPAGYRCRERVIGVVLAVTAMLSLGACGSIISDECGPGTPYANQANGDPCDPSWFSVRRGAYIGTVAQPLLANGEPERRAGNIDVRAVNRSPAARANFVGYVGKLRVDYPSEPSKVTQDAEELNGAGAPAFNPEDLVQVNFERATMDFFLQQMLTGALGVSYVLPSDVTGTVTFRTEQPLPKAQVLRVVRDVLARNGLAMRLSNGVFQIGDPQVIATMDNTNAVGRNGEVITRDISVPKGSAQRIIAVVQPLLPPNVTITAAGRSNALIVRGIPADIDDVSALITTLAEGGIAEDRVALIPLRQSNPERVAARLNEFYRSMLGDGVDSLTILPLEQQQALIIGSRDPDLMRSVQQMVVQIDRELGDKASLRIIPLVHLSAAEIAPQLQAAFAAASGGAPAQAEPSGQAKTASKSGGGGIPAGVKVPGAGETDEDGFAPPGFNAAGVGNAGSQPRPVGERLPVASSGNEAVVAASSGGGGGELRIVPDTRTNAIMVFSDFETFSRLRDVIRTLDVPDAQVIIEATIIEVRINDNLRYGVQWYLTSEAFNLRSGSTNIPTVPTGPGLGGDTSFTIGDVGVDVILNALQEVTKVKILSTPYLTVLNGRSARLVVGDQIPYATRTQSSSSGGNVSVTQQIEVVDTGVVLEVTPRIMSNNSVSLDINQTVSQPQASALEGNVTPVISTRTLKSEVIVQSGRTILLGGLVQERAEDQEEGVPVLKDVPIVGGLFKSKDDSQIGRTELVVLITPRVTRSSSQLEAITNLIRNKLSSR